MSRIIKSVDCPDETYKAGAVIFEEGGESTCFYIVKTGQIDIYRNYGKPAQTHLASIPEGRVLGEIACLDNGPRTATAVAKTDIRITRVSADTLKWQLKQCPSWFGAVVLDIVERLRATNDLVPAGKTGASQLSSMKATDES